MEAGAARPSSKRTRRQPPYQVFFRPPESGQTPKLGGEVALWKEKVRLADQLQESGASSVSRKTKIGPARPSRTTAGGSWSAMPLVDIQGPCSDPVGGL